MKQYRLPFRSILLFSFLLILFFGCKVTNLSHPCDTNTESYLQNSFIIQIFGIRSSGCYPPFLPGPTSKSRASLWGFHSLNAGAGFVRDMKIYGTKAIVSGVFDYMGPNTGSLAMVNGTNQVLLPESTCPYFELDGSINQIIDDGYGNAIVAGNFNYVQGVKLRALAKIKSDCTVDTTFNANMSDTFAEVRTLLIHNGKLYIGGIFTGTFSSNTSQTRNNLAAIHPDTGALDTGWNPNVSGEVNSIKTDGSSLYIGGYYNLVGATTVNNLSKVDLATGTVVSLLGEPDATVQALEIEGSNLYVGGNFGTIDGNTTSFLAKISNTGTFIWGNATIDGNVQSLQLANDKLYIGGNFSSPRPGLITIDPSNGNDIGKDFKVIPGGVTGIRLMNSKLFLFGSFLTILDSEPSYVSCLDPTTDTIVSWNARIAGANSQERGGIFKFSNGNYLIGGSFPTLQGKARTYLAEIDLLTGTPTEWNPSFSFPLGVEVIQAMHIYQNRLYVGGSFSAINSKSRTRFAAFDLSNEIPQLNELNISISGFTNSIRKISDFDSRIFISGGFNSVNGTTINHIFSLDPNTDQISFSFNPNTNFGINDFTKLSNGKFIIAGDLTLINGATSINRFAVVNESNGSLIQSPTGSALGLTYRIIESNGRLLVAFDNNAAPSSTGCCLGIYDIENLNPISHTLSIAPIAGAKINDLYVNQNELFLMGSFASVRSEIRKNFVSLSPETLQLSDFNPVFGADVIRMTESSSDYFFMGRFLTVSGRKRAYLVRFRKSDKSLKD
jgi:hypothetical protein